VNLATETSTSVVLIARPKFTLAASHAVPLPPLSHDEHADERDGRTPQNIALRFSLDAASVKKVDGDLLTFDRGFRIG